MKVEVVTPAEFETNVVGDLCSRRGVVQKTEPQANAQKIIATVPLSNMFSYISDLRSMSKGRATFSMEFEKYQELPENLVDELINGKAAAPKKKK